MKPMVLCITREALLEQGIPYEGSKIYPFNLNQVNSEDFHFINRNIVDSKHNLHYQSIGYQLPQVLPYIVITDGTGKYLSYSRKGTETRLHGSKSIGIGGHIDLEDLAANDNMLATIMLATHRELKEEILYRGYANFSVLHFNKIIVDTTNQVGKVHVGLFTTLVYPNAQPQEELYKPEWITKEELKANIDMYENWSQLIIKEL